MLPTNNKPKWRMGGTMLREREREKRGVKGNRLWWSRTDQLKSKELDTGFWAVYINILSGACPEVRRMSGRGSWTRVKLEVRSLEGPAGDRGRDPWQSYWATPWTRHGGGLYFWGEGIVSLGWVRSSADRGVFRLCAYPPLFGLFTPRIGRCTSHCTSHRITYPYPSLLSTTLHPPICNQARLATAACNGPHVDIVLPFWEFLYSWRLVGVRGSDVSCGVQQGNIQEEGSTNKSGPESLEWWSPWKSPECAESPEISGVRRVSGKRPEMEGVPLHSPSCVADCYDMQGLYM